jgi:hypothetical protein
MRSMAGFTRFFQFMVLKCGEHLHTTEPTPYGFDDAIIVSASVAGAVSRTPADFPYREMRVS